MSVKIEITIEHLDNGNWKYQLSGWTPGYVSDLNGVLMGLLSLIPYVAAKQQRAS